MTGIDPREAASALSDIEQIVRRVRQSTIYNLASLMLILWGALIFAGNIATELWPRQGGYIWIAVNVAGCAGSLAVGAFESRRMRVLLFAVGILWSIVLGQFTPRQLDAFWPTYFMMV